MDALPSGPACPNCGGTGARLVTAAIDDEAPLYWCLSCRVPWVADAAPATGSRATPAPAEIPRRRSVG